MRAVILACLLFLAPICGAMAESRVGVPVAKPGSSVVGGCPAGMASVSDVWPSIEGRLHAEGFGDTAMIMGGVSVRQLMGALASLVERDLAWVTTVVMFRKPDRSQVWILMAGGCSPGALELPPAVLKALYEALGQSI